MNPCLELTLKLVATFPPTHHQKFNFTQLMARWGSGEASGGKGRCVVSLQVTIGHLRVTISYLKATVVHIRVILGHLRVTLSHLMDGNIRSP